jgi:hypothetical protein
VGAGIAKDREARGKKSLKEKEIEPETKKTRLSTTDPYGGKRTYQGSEFRLLFSCSASAEYSQKNPGS